MMMIMGKEDVGLSLSLGFSQNHQHPLHLNVKPSSSLVSNLHMYPWNHHTFISSSDEENQEYVRKMEVKRVRRSSVECEDDERGVWSPKSTISSSMSGKRSEREGDETETLERSCSGGGGTNWEEEEGSDNKCRKKLRLSKHQSALLEHTFKDHNTLNPKQKLGLAKKLSLTSRQVEVWFQNRRARTKLKQTEVDCEYLKRCVEKLREENRRLQKEAAELRTLKLSPQSQFLNANDQMSPTPATTLLMCPSCHCQRHSLPSSFKTTNSMLYNHNHNHKQMGNGPILEF